MSGARSRAKGRRTQTEGVKILTELGWTTVDTSAGMAVEDCFAVDNFGCQWAVEITSDQSISLPAKWEQAKAQAKARGVDPLMLWKVDRAGWWLVARAHAFAPRRDLATECSMNPARVSLPTWAKAMASMRIDDEGAMPVLETGSVIVAPAEQALRRWWR